LKEPTTPSSKEARDTALVKRWLDEVQLHEKEFEEWFERCKKLLKRYRDEKPERGKSHFNVFWSNVETLKPALYARTPKPEIERMVKNNDPVSREACEILERATSNSIKEYDFDTSVKNIRDDVLRVGRGVGWVRYEPTMQEMKGPDGKTIVDEESKTPVEEVTYEKVLCDYVHWNDFLHGTARTWGEVKWVGRRSYLTRAEVKAKFGEQIAKEIQLNFLPKNVVQEGKKEGPEQEIYKKAQIIEIWDKTSKKVYWISDGYKKAPLKVEDDPLQLKEFFPCPRPLYATLTTDSLIPLPDYCMYQDLAQELDMITTREALLTEAVRVAGVYDESCEGVSDLLSAKLENALIPVKNWPAFSQQGGIEGAIDFLPLKEITAALQVLSERKIALKNELYELTGLSDIIRGASGPAGVTATEQQLKSQFGSLRISDRQYEMQRFVRDLVEIKAEIIAEHFSPETLAIAADVQFDSPASQQVFMQAVQLLKDDKLRSFRIGIETDSTIALDESQEKQDRNEFVQAIGAFMGTALPMMQQAPAFTPAIGEMLLFLARGFKAGRSLENALEQGVEQTMQQIQQAAQQPPPPDPAMMEAQSKQQIAQAELQMQQAKSQSDMALEQSKVQHQMQMDMMKAEHERELAEIKTRNELELSQLKAHMQAQQSAEDAEIKRQLMVQQAAAKKEQQNVASTPKP
jgi:hypothetical protein